MELPVRFVYIENGKEKSSIDELNRSLLNYGRDGIQRDSIIKDYRNGKKKIK